MTTMAAKRPLLDYAERIHPAAYWELLMNLTRREVKGRYSQSLFGVGWAIAQPLATMAVFTLVFSRLANMPPDGAPYPLFAYAGPRAVVLLPELRQLGHDEPDSVPQHRDQDLFPARDHSAGAGLFAAARFRARPRRCSRC